MQAFFSRCVFGFCLAACGGQTRDPGGGEDIEQPRSGWSIRDDVPYPRSGHSAVLDEANDRMIVFGGGANDVWALPLSGPSANRWTQLHAEGKHPPSHSYGTQYGASGLADSAVYDPIGRRMLVLLNPAEQLRVELWELALSGTPEWKRVAVAGQPQWWDVARGCLALDAENRRLFVTGGSYDSGIWALSLGGTPSWTRIGENPARSGNSDVHSCLIFDAVRQKLVLFGALLGEVWELSPETAAGGILEGARGIVQRGSGATAVLDPDGARLVSYGGDLSEGEVFVYELATDTLTSAEAPYFHAGPVDASAVLDAKRRRILYFGGNKKYPSELEPATNAVSALALDTLAWSELVPASRYTDSSMALRTTVWDPVRAAAVAYGHPTESATLVHGLEASAAWTPLPTLEPAPPLSLSAAVYDPEARAIVSFGGFFAPEPRAPQARLASNALARLASVPDATWESFDAGAGPLERSAHVAVYDSARRRMVIHGGDRNLIWTPSETLDDVWALSLDGSGGWTKLEPRGTSPGARSKHLGVYDPTADRLLIYGSAGGERVDLWSLSLGDAPEWTELFPSGQAPGLPSEGASAVYDPGHDRMIVLDFTETGVAGSLVLDKGVGRVFALELDTLVWHKFCPPGLTVAKPRDVSTIGKAVLAPDGLFVTISGGAFRFDLETPYCDQQR
jgi:hypothetical protein